MPEPLTTGVDRSQLHQIIAGLSEGVILIEPDQRITWANAAALAMHGATDLAELGGTVSAFRDTFVLRYRNNHVITRTPIERVLAGETFDEVIVNVRRTDRADFNATQRVRSLVITDAAGAPDCLVLILADVTSQFEAEERFEKTFNANPAPAVICRLSDLRHVKVNLGFLEMTGYRSADVIGRSVYEIDVLNEARSRDLAIARLNAGETIPQMEACLRLPDGGTRFVIVAGQPIDMGDEPCMLFTFADLELRKKAETALRHSEERFATAFRLTPVPTLLCRADGLAVLGINQAFSRTFGHEEDAVIGQALDAIGLWADRVQRERFGAELSAQGSVLGFEACLRRHDGVDLDCLVSAESVTIGEEACLLAVLQDISDRKRSERELFDAIEAVMADTSWFSRGLIEKLGNLRQSRASDPAPARPDLTRREAEVLRLICQGLGDGAIAKRLGLTPNTVRNHAAALYRKLGIHRRGEAIIWGRDNGFAS
jgi:PAS domain S-box-containing protein